MRCALELLVAALVALVAVLVAVLGEALLSHIGPCAAEPLVRLSPPLNEPGRGRLSLGIRKGLFELSARKWLSDHVTSTVFFCRLPQRQPGGGARPISER